MDGRGAWRDNVFVERLWRSVKYERVYLKAYDSVSAARADVAEYLAWYNVRRPHSNVGGRTPEEANRAARRRRATEEGAQSLAGRTSCGLMLALRALGPDRTTMSNPWTKKNPLMSMWLSAANSFAGGARGQAMGAAKRQVAANQAAATQQALEFWFGKPKTRVGRAKRSR
jgi:hypothetical protein